jgi:hypothetical protein
MGWKKHIENRRQSVARLYRRVVKTSASMALVASAALAQVLVAVALGSAVLDLADLMAAANLAAEFTLCLQCYQ